MKIRTITDLHGKVHAHQADCQSITKNLHPREVALLKKSPPSPYLDKVYPAFDFESQLEVQEEYNADFGDDPEDWTPITFHGCTDGLGR